MKCFIFVGLIFFSAFSKAAVQWEFYPLNADIRYDRGEDLQVEQRHPLNFGLAAAFGSWAVVGEFSRYQVKTGNDYVGIIREHQEEVFWGRREYKITPEFFIGGQAGLGLAEETVSSKIGSARAVDYQNNFIQAVGAEVGVLVQKTLRLSLEGRLFFGPTFDPSPSPDAVFRIGFIF